MILAVVIPTNYTFATFFNIFYTFSATFFIYFHVLFATFFLFAVTHTSTKPVICQSLLKELTIVAPVSSDSFRTHNKPPKRETFLPLFPLFPLFLCNILFTVRFSHLPQSALSSDGSLSELLPHHSGPGIPSSVRSSRLSCQNLRRILRSSRRIHRPEYHLPE